MTPILRQLTTAELSITLLFFDGEEGLVSFTSTDGTYGSRHLAQQWDDNSYDVGSSGELCQNEPADFLDRMDLLFLMDLIGTPDPNFQSIQVVCHNLSDRKVHYNVTVITSYVVD